MISAKTDILLSSAGSTNFGSAIKAVIGKPEELYSQTSTKTWLSKGVHENYGLNNRAVKFDALQTEIKFKATTNSAQPLPTLFNVFPGHTPLLGSTTVSTLGGQARVKSS